MISPRLEYGGGSRRLNGIVPMAIAKNAKTNFDMKTNMRNPLAARIRLLTHESPFLCI